MRYLSKMKKIHITIEISDSIKEGHRYYPNFLKGYINQVRGHKIVKYITEGFDT